MLSTVERSLIAAASATAVDFTEAVLELPDFTVLAHLTRRRGRTPAHSAATITAEMSIAFRLADIPALEGVFTAEVVSMEAVAGTGELAF
jgi:hypothetical protein